MNIHPHFNLGEIKQYLAQPDAQRPFARYKETLLESISAFTPQEIERLLEIVRMDSPQYSRYSINKLLIDLSWASSHLEGNTYTQLDTQVLIEYGEKNKDKPPEDAAMILNHKKAIEHMLAHATETAEQGCGTLSEHIIYTIHKALADNRMAPDSRHFLELHQCGVVRTYTPSGLHISGSSYLPPQAEDRPVGYIEKQFNQIINSANALPDAINQSFFIMTRIPYLQVFYDANKRTSRISCNIPLITNGLSPLSFVDFDKKKYIEGLLAFYELGDERLAKTAWLHAYLLSAFRYLPLGEEARYALSTQREQCLQEAVRYVLEAIRPTAPIWQTKTT